LKLLDVPIRLIVNFDESRLMSWIPGGILTVADQSDEVQQKHKTAAKSRRMELAASFPLRLPVKT
jgi:hypothetical protein